MITSEIPVPSELHTTPERPARGDTVRLVLVVAVVLLVVGLVVFAGLFGTRRQPDGRDLRGRLALASFATPREHGDVQLSDQARAFLEAARSAAMITLRRDGSAHAVRVGVALVDGKVWSSGTADRVRTRHVRRDPRATLIVFGSGREALSIDATVKILEGPDVPELSWKLFSVMQRAITPAPPPGHLTWYGKQKTREEFLQAMIDERRLIYEFDVIRDYGLQR